MQQLQHPNLPKLLQVPPMNDPHFCLMTQCMDTDLGRVIRSKQDLTEEHCMFFAYQILEVPLPDRWNFWIEKVALERFVMLFFFLGFLQIQARNLL